ncbi:ornithine cyclodeaminase family protein [Bradyrhizobium sp. BWA-3-5]|uniref:ornithine cyclodeaminase family protein n=1 Tax=Bradyrhizobium sp. BWA-3-5 TaxID=3080013 RepID=UPI00293F59F0|nr:ornithine cyclodeaminase family protein [Bradyrhizobium sp. BWA-3-5]WOH63954.1 ornithine cyclodeaminase family protein [Bradyrhizobium sp. BWA-3-5]
MKVLAVSPELLYLSNGDIQSLQISPADAREAVLAAFRDNAAGRNISLPRSSIDIAPGHLFHSLSAASEVSSIATVKWVAVVPVEAKSGAYGINSLVCVSDYNTGLPVAVLDGNSITLIRTAAMSAAAAVHLAPETPTSIGLVGCGSQAFSHLDAFVDLFPSLRRIHLLSRSVNSAEKVATAASEKGLDPIITKDPDALLAHSDIVISMVPRSPRSKPFLNARLLPSSSFASAVDAGSSWYPESFTAFDRLVTDCFEQGVSPLDALGRPIESVRFQDELAHVASNSSRVAAPTRALFSFRGFAIADLAIAELAIRKARAIGIGTILPR